MLSFTDTSHYSYSKTDTLIIQVKITMVLNIIIFLILCLFTQITHPDPNNLLSDNTGFQKIDVNVLNVFHLVPRFSKVGRMITGSY